MRPILMVFGILFFMNFYCRAQQVSDSTQLWQITTVDGNRFIGFIIDDSNTILKFKTFDYGILNIPAFKVSSRKKLNTPIEKKIPVSTDTLLIDSKTVWRIVTDDGFDFVGTIKSKNDVQLEIESSKFGTVKIQRVNIKSMHIVTQDQFVKGEVWFENAQASRYFYTPNGYGMKKDEAYYQNVWVLFNQVSYAFTDYFTLGVGTVPLFLFGSDVFPLWITPKFSIPIVENKFNLGAGAIAGAAVGESIGFGLLYGVATYGSKDRNVTLGAGYGYADGEWAKLPTITAATMIRTGKKGYFISENYLISSADESVAIFSFGGRTIWPRLSLDYGLVIPIYNNMDTFVAIPWLGFVIPFGESPEQQLK